MGNSMNTVAVTSDNSGHTATMPRTFAQIQPYGWTSYVRRTLYEMAISKMKNEYDRKKH